MTRIGTPLSPSSLKVMFLGGGGLGKEVGIELQRLGVETIVVDRYENAPGHQVAHRAHVIDMTDARTLRKFSQALLTAMIVPLPSSTAMRVASEFRIPRLIDSLARNALGLRGAAAFRASLKRIDGWLRPL